MIQSPLGSTGLTVSRLSFGASALGGVFRSVDEATAIRAVHAALDAGITYFDVAPAYGATRSETVLGKALKGIPRNRYVLSTKVGKYTRPGSYGDDEFDYSESRILASLDESAARLGTDRFDIIHLHDFEYDGGKHTEWALGEGLNTLHALKAEGRIRAVSCGIYPMDLWYRVINEVPIDAALTHNHYCLNDTRLLELLPLAEEKGIGLINASPFGSGLLTDRGPADWHPANAEQRACFRKAAEFCQQQGISISQLALQFSCQHPDIPTTMFSSANPDSVKRNVDWSTQPVDTGLVSRVQDILAPVRDVQWDY
jgi:aryl-alcohol dehydrogenase-like predicted oxidoreductase